MKKKIIVLALVAAFAISFISAGNLKADLAIGMQDVGMKLSFKNSGDTNKLTSTIEANISATVDLLFSNNIGMNVLLGTDFKNEFKVGTGFLYMTNMSTTSIFSASVGPFFIFNGTRTHMGIYLTADFDFILAKSLFLRIGTGMDLDFLQFGGGDTTTNTNVSIPLPRLALGWKF